MKKSALILLLVFALLKSHAQNYLVSFAGSGAAATVSSVLVSNLTSGASVTLNSGDVLHLSGTVGLDKPLAGKGKLEIYPNPVASQATISFYAAVNGNVKINITDVSGKTICQESKSFSAGMQSFSVSGTGKGMYFVNVCGNGFNYSGKLLSQGRQGREVGIDYVSPSPVERSSPLKSSDGTVVMLYKTGDQLLYKGISGIYSTLVPDVPTGNKTITFTFVACTDKDNNNYTVVKVDKQLWMAENLKTTRYSDGSSIPLVRDNAAWGKLSTPGYCWYMNDSVTYKDVYGAMYNWYAVNTTKLAPAGWHVPKDAEWTVLTTFLGGETVAGGTLKETGLTHWKTPNEAATNQYGFSALPGGYRITNGVFNQVGNFSYWWSATEYDATTSWYRGIFYGTADVYNNISNKFYGYSVRCVHD